MLFPNSLPDDIFRRSKCQPILKSRILEPFSTPRGCQNDSFERHFQPKWLSKGVIAFVPGPPWSRPGRNLAPKTLQGSIFVDLGSFWDDFGRILNKFGIRRTPPRGAERVGLGQVTSIGQNLPAPLPPDRQSNPSKSTEIVPKSIEIFIFLTTPNSSINFAGICSDIFRFCIDFGVHFGTNHATNQHSGSAGARSVMNSATSPNTKLE